MTRWLGWGLLAACVVASGYLAALNPDPITLVVAPGRTRSLPLAVVLTGAVATGALGVGAVSGLAGLRRLLAARRARHEERRRARQIQKTERARDLAAIGEYERARDALGTRGATAPEVGQTALLAESMLHAGDAAGARALLGDALAQPGDSLRLLPLLAEAAERAGDLDAATDAIERALHERPDSPRLLRRLRDLQARAERWPQALATAERLVTQVRAPALLEDELATLRGLRYQVALDEPDDRRAARALLALAREDPAFVPAWLAAGDRLLAAGRPLRARRAWRRGATHRPHPVLLDRLEAHDAAEGRTSRTTRIYRRLVRRHADDRTLRLLFARHLLRTGATAEAASVLDASPEGPATDALRGELARLQGDFERAAGAFARAVAPAFGLDLAWRCAACGEADRTWHARCTRCRRWNTLATSSRLISTAS
jgi:lipopolysaccharide biosynthesis regulator YciM